MKKFLLNWAYKNGIELRRSPALELSGMATGLKWYRDNGFNFRTIIDVGASDGQWSKECMEFFPESNYLLFEPHPAHAKGLHHFASSHASVIADPRAVGALDGRVLFDVSDLYGGGIDARGDKSESVEVPMVKLDSAVKEHRLNGSFLIKLDTHGFEKAIIEGARNILQKTEALVVECYNYQIEPEALLFWDFCGYMREKGFRPIKIVDVLDRKVDNSLWQMDIFFVRESWSGFDDIRYQ